MDWYIGTILMWPVSWPPRGWALCQGQLLQISSYQALYSLIGTTYGGNGQTTFALPNISGRAPLGASSQYPIGQASGNPMHTLTINEMPAHAHSAHGLQASIEAGTTAASATTPAAGQILATPNGETSDFSAVTVRMYGANVGPTVALDGGAVSGTTGAVGGSQPFSIMQPYLVMNYIICLEGLFPPRS